MSIWTELLFLHGHIATPIALAVVAPVASRAAAACDAVAPAAVAADPSSSPGSAAPAAAYGHPLRATGQLR